MHVELKRGEIIFKKTRNYPTGSAMLVVVCYSTSFSTNLAWKFLYYFTVAVTLKKAWIFVPVSLLHHTHQKYKTKDLIEVSFEHFKIYRKRYARASMFICIKILCFSFIPFWCKLHVWKLLSLVTKAFSKSVKWVLPKLQSYNATFSKFNAVILWRLPIKNNNQIDMTKSSLTCLNSK